MRQGGFTLIELLVTLAVVVIMATIAVPGFQNMMASNRLASDYNEILSGLHFARSEAIKRRDNVAFKVVSGSPWEYRVYRLADGDDASSALRLRKGEDSSITVTVEDDAIVQFGAMGKVVEGSACETGCGISVAHGPGRCSVIAITGFGRVGRDDCDDT